MAESKAEQIFEAVRAELAAIQGDGGTTYWNTTSQSLAAADLTADCLDSTVGDPATVYVVVPGVETRLPMALSGVRQGLLELDVIGAQAFTPETENPYTAPPPIRRTVQNRLARDIERALTQSAALLGSSGLALSVDVANVDRSAQNTYLSGWALVILGVHVLYQYVEALP